MRASFACGAIACLAAATAHPAAKLPSSRELAELSLKQLGQFEVTSVSRRAEPLSDALASIYVITAEAIRRSGARSLPEALRLAPNLQVGQASATGYAIRARGATNNSANKLLVLVDGRSVYSPLFSGIFWDVQDVVLADVERIEVVSGPGGTLWGVNAVNGVINVITRSALATRGALADGAAGDAQSDVAVRYGAAAGENGALRIFSKYFDRASTATAQGLAVNDAAHLAQAGFRGDWKLARDTVTFQGGAYRGTMDQPLPGSISISGTSLALGPIPVTGAHFIAAWTHRFDSGSQLAFNAYVDRTERTVPPTFADRQDILNLQVQHSSRPMKGTTMTLGAEYRAGRDRVRNSDIFAFLPADLDQEWASAFAQAEHEITRDVRVIAGARFERNDYTGMEFLPTLRVGWRRPSGVWWAAASRTVRAPSRLDADAYVPGRAPFLLQGGPQVPAEVAEVIEVGYRGTVRGALTYSVTAFSARYKGMHTQEVDPTLTHLVFAGNMGATTHGVEAWGTWQAARNLRLSAGFTAQRQRFRLDAGSNDAAAPSLAGRDPAHTWQLRAALQPSARTELDVIVRAVAALSAPDVPAYRAVDLRFGWRPQADLDLFVAARNLGGGHGEFTAEATRTEIEPSFHAGLQWRFEAR